MKADISRYEQAFANATGRRHAIAFAYARTALAAILRALGVAAGDRVVLSPLTCKVVPLALLGAGFVPVYADIQESTLNLDPERARAAAAGARAIVFQHTYGWSAGAGAVARVAAVRGVPMVDDCAQCLPQSGAFEAPGVAAIFSNNPGKPLPAASGGIAAVNDDALADRIRRERDALPTRGAVASFALRAENAVRNRLPHALYWPALALHQRFRGNDRQDAATREVEREIGDTARRITAADARAGERWLAQLPMIRQHRSAACAGYAAALGSVRTVHRVIEGDTPPLYYYPVLVADKDKVLERARARGVQLVAWPGRTPIYPIDDEAELRRYGYEPGSCPVAERVARSLIGLPTDIMTGEGNRAAVLRVLSGS